MKNNSVSRTVVKIIIWITAVVLVLAAIAVCLVRFWLVPKYTRKLAESGNEALAEIVTQNNNLGTYAKLGSVFADKGVRDFVANLNRETASAALEVLDTLENEQLAAEPQMPVSTPVPTEVPWQVETNRHIHRATPAPTPEPTTEPEEEIPDSPPETAPKGATAYERISNAATDKDMADGLAIISKLDMGYISKLLQGGLTGAEKTEIYKYVHTILSGSEISRGLELYKKYSKYL